MTDTNNKEETFESYFDYWIEHNFGRGELMQLKQLHDKEIKELKSKLRTCICFKCGSKAINENGSCIDCGCYQWYHQNCF